MIQLNDLRKQQKELIEVTNDELRSVLGGNPLGAVAGGIGGAVGQIGLNSSKGVPLDKDLYGAIGTNAAFGAFNPVSGPASFLTGVGKAGVGAFTVPQVIDAGTNLLLPGGFTPFGLDRITF